MPMSELMTYPVKASAPGLFRAEVIKVSSSPYSTRYFLSVHFVQTRLAILFCQRIPCSGQLPLYTSKIKKNPSYYVKTAII